MQTTNKMRLITIGFLIILSILAIPMMSCSSKKTTDNGIHENLFPGDSYTFAGYQWLVLAVENGRALLLAERCIKEYNYHYTSTLIPTTYEESVIRAELYRFYNYTLNEAERARIATVTQKNLNNQNYGTNGGKDTSDPVFLLSLEEVVKYFGDSGNLGKPNIPEIIDQFDSKRQARHHSNNNFTNWWLRSPGNDNRFAAYVHSTGGIVVFGQLVNRTMGLRPALWIKL